MSGSVYANKDGTSATMGVGSDVNAHKLAIVETG